ncbi:MAG: GGDEF domain-containing protein [Butyrivibrio sp.]|nr:GGDEF domain-containing protein [Butyrivibrio sp.]
MQMPYEFQIKPFMLLVILVSIVSLSIILSRTNVNVGNRKEIVAFRGMLISFMVFSIIDLRQLWGESFFTTFPLWFTNMIIAVGFAAMSFSCFFWFLHVFASLNLNQKILMIGNFPVWKILIHIPLFICLLLIFTPLHSFVYDSSDPAFVFRPGAMSLLLLDYVYLILATAISVYCKKRAKNKIEKKKYSSQMIFIVLFTLSGLMIGFFVNYPAIELCFIPIVLKLFVDLQDSQIFTDVLTKLYNRRRMTDFITDEISTCSTEAPFTIIMIDLDFFKNINDILGHDEGDKALVSFSNAIQNAIKFQNAIASRWGGDEFVVAGKDKNLPQTFKDNLQAEISKMKDLSFTTSFSLGLYCCTSSEIAIEQALAKADEALYQDKEVQHRSADEYIERLRAVKKDL